MDRELIAHEDLLRFLFDVKASVREVEFLIRQIDEGKIHAGYFVERFKGDCGCLIGTIAIARNGKPLVNRGFQDAEEKALALLGIPDYGTTAMSVGGRYAFEGYIGDVDLGDTAETNHELANIKHWLNRWLEAQ